jgi:tetratricopeptide (TPR) repeat protein
MTFLWDVRIWFESRPYWRLWWSIPALLTLAAWGVFGLMLSSWTPGETRACYSSAATKALAARDYQTARIASQRLLLTEREARGPGLFQLALAKNGLGQAREAAALLKLAAPLEKPGYAPAHLMAARSLLAATNVTTPVFKEVEAHLKHALKLEPNSVEASELLGRVYFQMGAWDLAQERLQAVVTARPGAALMLATLAKRSGDDIGMKRWAGRAAKYYRDKVNETKEDSPRDRLACVQALAMQEDYAEAIQTLDDGRKRSGNPIYPPALANLYASWAEQVARQEPRNVGARLNLIQQGLACEPKNVRLLKLLIALSRMEGPEGNAARDSLTNLMAEGGSSAMLHFILGSDAWQQGAQEEARNHLTLAFEQAPDLPVVANNMALLLALGHPPDLPRALAIIQPLVERFPGEPHFRETRGQIFVKLGRWKEAVKDLELALPQLRDKGATHTALAQAYQNLGMQRLQAEHERLAKESAQRKPAKR